MAKDSTGNDQLDSVSLDLLPRWLRDFIDINNEAAGRETGRARRFIASDTDGPASSAEKKDAERRLSALLILLQDPAYARLYHETTNAVTRAEDAAERATKKLLNESKIASAKVQTLLDNAVELPDGRKIFKSKDGRFLTAEGQDVTSQATKVRGLTAQSPGWEEYSQAFDRVDDIDRRIIEVEAYRTDVLDPARQRLSDTGRPLAPNELRGIQDRLDNTPPDVKAELEDFSAAKAAPNGAASIHHDEYKLDAPELMAEFQRSSSVIPDDAFAPPSSAPVPKR